MSASPAGDNVEQHGWCLTCQDDVLIDGRQANEDGFEWTHLRVVVTEEVGMGHAPGCWGDCNKHGCPVPEPMLRQDLVECGPVRQGDPA